MKRVKGLSNENYRERKEAISRILKAAYEGYAADPVPPEWLAALDRK
jgi:hypothetical protein